MSGVLAYVLHHDGAFYRDSLGALSEAARLASQLGEEAAAVVIGERSPSDELCAALGRHGAGRVYRAGGEEGLAQPAVDALAEVVRRNGYRYVLLGGGLLAFEIGGALAARLGAGVTMEVTGARLTDHGLVALRSALGDLARVEVGYVGEPGVVIGRRGAFEVTEGGARRAHVEHIEFEPSPWSARARLLRRGDRRAGEAQVEDAQVVVAGGRGVGGPERFAELEALARALGGVVAATRAAVDAGWYPYDAQVGQTGKSVAPRLYLAVGVSGAMQHKVGVRAAEHVIAVNSDPGAPIFQWSDLGVIGDLAAIVPRLTAAVHRRANRGTPSLK